MTLQRRASPFNFLADAFHRHDEISYRDLAEHLSDAFFLVTPRTGLFQYFNHAALELTGYSREELERLSLAELLSAPEAAEALNLIHKLDVSLTLNLHNTPVKVKGGEQIETDLRVTAAFSDGEVSVFILARDPGQRLLLEQVWRDYHHSLNALNTLADLLVTHLDKPAADTLQQMLWACQHFTMADTLVLYHRAADFPGYQLHEAINLLNEFPPSIGNVDPAASGAPLTWHAGERPASVLARAARAAGLAVIHIQPVGAQPTPAALLLVGYRSPQLQTVDTFTLARAAANFIAAGQTLNAQITIRAIQEQQATETRRRFETVLHETAEGLVRVNAEGQVIEINRAAESLLGFSRIDTLNLPLEDMLISAQPLAQPMVAALQKGLPWGGVETDLIRRDGVSVAVFIRAIPLSEGEAAQGGLVLISDRTDQRLFQVQSDHLERRAWLGDLSAIFAHDVRNPLNGLATGLSYLSSKFEASHPLADSIGKMQAEVNRIEQLLKNVLLVAKSNELNFRPVALAQLLDRILIRWGNRLALHTIQLETDLDPQTPLALADTHQMDQVFTNLIVNAYEAMSDTGGTLSVKCHAATHAKTPRGDYVQILFSDTGPGISPAVQTKIFDPFVTTKSEGTGIGLAITKRIVTGHKGSIFVESWPGIGTAFYVFIPIA